MINLRKGNTFISLPDVQSAIFEKNGWARDFGDRSSLSLTLREQADALGLTYHPNIGDEKLREKIEGFKLKKQ